MADNAKTLARGEAVIPVRDASTIVMTVDATDQALVTTTSRQFSRASSACTSYQINTSLPQSDPTRFVIATHDQALQAAAPLPTFQQAVGPSFSEASNLRVGILGYLSLDAAVGISALDASPVENWLSTTGASLDAAQGSSTAQPLYRASVAPNAQPFLEFDGTDDFFNIRASNTLNVIHLQDDYYIEAVVQFTNLAANQTVFSQEDPISGGFLRIRHDTVNLTVDLLDLGVLGALSLSGAVVAGVAQHIVVRRIGTTTELWLAGVLAQTNTEASVRVVPSGRAYLGSLGTSSEPLAAQVGLFRVAASGDPAADYTAFLARWT